MGCIYSIWYRKPIWRVVRRTRRFRFGTSHIQTCTVSRSPRAAFAFSSCHINKCCAAEPSREDLRFPSFWLFGKALGFYPQPVTCNYTVSCVGVSITGSEATPTLFPIPHHPLCNAINSTAPYPNGTEFAFLVTADVWNNPHIGFYIEATSNDLRCDGMRFVVISDDDYQMNKNEAYRYATVFTSSFGRTPDVYLSSSADQLVDGTIIKHVKADGISNSYGYRERHTLLFLRSDSPLTSPIITWNKQYVSFTWRDAAAAMFAILNLAITIISVLFPMTALTPHARVFWLDRHEITASQAIAQTALTDARAMIHDSPPAVDGSLNRRTPLTIANNSSDNSIHPDFVALH